MPDPTSNLRQVLAQTESVAKIQEKAKRRGEVQQQQATRRFADKVDIQGMQVEETPETESERKVNEDEQGEDQGSREDLMADEEAESQDESEYENSVSAEAEAEEVESENREEGKGCLFDKTA